jgi:LysR family hydrogen peroxide-inducible transcriptional activator
MEDPMDFRHLEALVAIADEGSFTAAADALNTVQSNVSGQIRQLETEIGVPLLVRSRRGAALTEAGRAVVTRARRIQRERDGILADVAALEGLQIGEVAFGIVGTASRWLVPELVGSLRRRAPGVRLRINEGTSERLVAEVLSGQLAQAIVTAPVLSDRLISEHLLDERLVGLVPEDSDLADDLAVPLERIARLPMVMPPANNPLRLEVQEAAAKVGVELQVPIEVEGVRLIGELVGAGAGISILPETAIDPDTTGVRTVPVDDLPPRRLVLVTPLDAQLSFADRAVRERVFEIVAARRPSR